MLFDEMKLKAEIAFHSRSGKVLGFVGDADTTKISLDNELLSILDKKEMEVIDKQTINNKQPATYVNQWKVRCIYGPTHNAKYFLIQTVTVATN